MNVYAARSRLCVAVVVPHVEPAAANQSNADTMARTAWVKAARI
jgi:hypothetical protein